MISENTILEAHERIKPYIIPTPVLTSEALNDAIGGSLFFKCENLQAIGAFKARGATNAVLSLSKEERINGVATHSSGNHAQALARAAGLVQTKAYVVMPRTVPLVKKNGVISYNGIIIECEPTLESRESKLKEVIERTGATEIHPYNNYAVIAGQATAAKELIEEVNDLDFIVAPVGGGGLISGTALSAKYFSPGTKVIAGEPEGADDAYRSKQSGKIEMSQSDSIADGLLSNLGDKTFPIIRDEVQRIITVSDQEIIAAMKMVWEKLKVIIEPSAAVALAAVLREKEKFHKKRVGVIFTGGNVDLEKAFEYFRSTKR
jgi:threonine dehydratase